MIRIKTTFGALVCSLSLVPLAAARAESTYWRMSTDHMTVIAYNSTKRCTVLAKQFVAYERVIKDLANIDADTDFPPLAVYALSEPDSKVVFLSPEEKKEQRTKDVRIYSKYLPGQSVNVAAIVDIAFAGDEPLQSVLLLYGQSMLSTGSIRLYPPWYQVGIANITNGLLIRDDGSALLNRNVMFEPVVEKQKGPISKFDLAALLSAKANSLAIAADMKEFSKRSREWAQYGLLTTPERKSKFRELATLMRQGTPASEAVSQAFAVSLEQLSAEFDDGKWRKQVDYKIPAPQVPPTLPACERVEPEKVAGLLSLVSERVENSPRR